VSFPALADLVLVSCISTFGRTVTYTPTVGDAFSLVAVFDAEGSKLSIDGGEIEIASPRLGVRLADLPSAPVQGDTWEIDGVVYRVSDMIPDGQGGSMLFGEIPS
jgi:hypothetical protein